MIVPVQLFNFFSTNHNEKLVLLDDRGRVRSQITSVVCQIQRFDFDCILVVPRKVIIINMNTVTFTFKTSIHSSCLHYSSTMVYTQVLNLVPRILYGTGYSP